MSTLSARFSLIFLVVTSKVMTTLYNLPFCFYVVGLREHSTHLHFHSHFTISYILCTMYEYMNAHHCRIATYHGLKTEKHIRLTTALSFFIIFKAASIYTASKSFRFRLGTKPIRAKFCSQVCQSLQCPWRTSSKRQSRQKS